MATSATPYGLRPVNALGGRYVGATRQIKIADGYADNIYNGSVVKIVAAGTIEIVLDTGADSDPFVAGTVGVFVGCAYTDTGTGQFVHRQYWPTGQAAVDAVAYVVDDPTVLFQAQMDGVAAQLTLGANTHLAAVQSTSTGSTLTGNSNSALSASNINTTDGDAFRIIDFVNNVGAANGGSVVGDAFTDVLIKFTHVAHSYTNPTGI